MKLFKAFYQHITLMARRVLLPHYHRKAFALSAVMSPLNKAPLKISKVTIFRDIEDEV